ncbi:eukaryotic translation initiation factor 3subunit I [Striga asiatica]|uniref:Eukaryotic translation initiation factor 3subunit I n=1 Tax=Striga asiatica TaxID=4170 RepID=A0A5A7QE75_STRAF|nr:eukaryotic translation initiation factor 3subunit I [Striga asiatica]
MGRRIRRSHGGFILYALKQFQRDKFMLYKAAMKFIVRMTKSSVTSAKVSQDGRYITIADGLTVDCLNKGYHGPVHYVRFLPGGGSYALGYEDGAFRIWQTGPTNNAEQESSGPSLSKVITQQIENVHITDEDKPGQKAIKSK